MEKSVQKMEFSFTYIMDEEDIVYGLGESNRGINKRGFIYTSNCTDDPEHTEDKHSLYGAHNLIIVSGKNLWNVFDYPAAITFDIGYTRMDTMKVTCENADLKLYVIEGESPYDIVKQFRHVIGRSYIPPKFAFGFGQSRWGYTTKEDFRKVAAGYRENHIPIDMIYMDIDYMQSYKDFTLSEENFQLGYYRNAAATVKAFVANPLQTDYPETIYRTGDLASYGEDGLPLFRGTERVFRSSIWDTASS